MTNRDETETRSEGQRGCVGWAL